MGAGYIACEQACIFNNFGSEVHMLYMEEIALAGQQPLSYQMSCNLMVWSSAFVLHYVHVYACIHSVSICTSVCGMWRYERVGPGKSASCVTVVWYSAIHVHCVYKLPQTLHVMQHGWLCPSRNAWCNMFVVMCHNGLIISVHVLLCTCIQHHALYRSALLM